MTMDVLTAAFNVGHDFKGGVVALAPQIGKNDSTLNAELAQVGNAKLGLHTAVKMTLASGDLRILDAFNLACGRMSFPLPEMLDLESKDCIQALATASREFSELCTEVLQSITDDGKINDNERERIHKEGGHTVSRIGSLMAAVDANHAASKPAHLRAA